MMYFPGKLSKLRNKYNRVKMNVVSNVVSIDAIMEAEIIMAKGM